MGRMTTEISGAIQQVFDGLAAGDADRIMDAYTDDVVGIDEVARAWMYGRDEMAAYTESMVTNLSNCRSELTEVHESVTGETAIVTGVLQQEYEWAEEMQSVVMPATFVLRHENDRWRVCLFHALPIPS